MAKEKIVLAYSGGLDTSVSVKWLQEKYDYDVIALGLNVGEGKDLDAIKQKALNVGAIKAITIDAKELLAEEYILPALKANALYEGKYPISSALSRPLISKLLVEVAEKEGATAVAHGCTGKGNDQVRFEVSVQALNPHLKVVAPVREWGMTRDEEIAYAEKNGIPIPVDLDNPFSIDANIWGRACEAGVLENPWAEAPEAAYDWTNPISQTPDEAEYIDITFEQGVPVALKVVAPVREWGMTRDEEIAYAEKNGIPIPVDLDNPFSIDANIWGRACEAGVLENPWAEAPEAAFDWTNPIALTPDAPEYIEITFEQGVPVALNDQKFPLVQLIEMLNEKGGLHGVGRIDHIENRLVGIKSREVYENPAALILINAHKELEFLTHPREVTQFKTQIDQQMAKLIYEGLWFSPLKSAMDAFVNETQKVVTGKVRVKLHKGTHVVVGRQSPYSLYNEELATYTKGDAFDHNAAVGFIKLWGLPTKVYAEVHKDKPTEVPSK